MRIFKAIKIFALFAAIFILSIFLLRPVIRYEVLKNHWIKFPSVIPVNNWKKFSSVEEQYSIWFPGIPECTNIMIEVSNFDLTATCTFVWNRQTEFAVNYSAYPTNFERLNKMTAKQKYDISQSAVGREVGKIVYQKDITYAGYPARDFEYQVLGKINYSGRVRLILINDRLYQLVVVFLTANPHSEDRDTFFNSFRLQN